LPMWKFVGAPLPQTMSLSRKVTNGDDGAKVEAPAAAKFLSPGVTIALLLLEEEDEWLVFISLLEIIGEFLPIAFLGVTLGIALTD